MKPNLPYWLFLGAMGSIALSNACKENFPDTLGRVFVLNWGSAIVSAFLFSIGLFLSLCGLFSQQDKRKQYVLPCLLNLAPLLALPALYFASYVLFTKIYYLSDSFPSMLPKLVETSRTADTEAKRLKAAQAAYELYGVTIAYRQENGEFTPYSPSAKDTAIFMRQTETNKRIKGTKEIMNGAMNQWPYLFGFYLGAFFLTFIVGTLWVAFKKSGADSNVQS